MPTRTPLDYRRWFDRMQPQTLQIATWLLYFDAFWALLSFISQDGWLHAARIRYDALGALFGIGVIAAYVLGGFLMANDRKLGYRLAVVAAFSPFVLRFWVLSGSSYSIIEKLTGDNLLNFIFEVALCALLLHPQSRDHQRIWYR